MGKENSSIKTPAKNKYTKRSKNFIYFNFKRAPIPVLNLMLILIDFKV